jgi:hypothetical protein
LSRGGCSKGGNAGQESGKDRKSEHGVYVTVERKVCEDED